MIVESVFCLRGEKRAIMARLPRQSAQSGVYHVIIRGINRQRIFEDEEDYRRFTEILSECKDVSLFTLFAYALMDNHVHLLIKIGQEPLELVLKRISCRYVPWFNRKYDRVGHLFQDRFKSEPIEDDAYFICAASYIIWNPVKSNGGMPLDYAHSSAREYAGESCGITDTTTLVEMLGQDGIERILREPQTEIAMEADPRRRTDSDAAAAMRRICGCETAAAFQKLEKAEQNKAISLMRGEGFSIRMASRVTGTSIGFVRGCVPIT